MRGNILRMSGRCFSCLRKGHLSWECRSKSRYSKCTRRHHFTICSKFSAILTHPSDTSLPNETPTQVASSQSTSDLDPNAASFAATSMYIDANKTMLLQTARAPVYDPTASHSPREIRLVLDALALNPEGNQHMPIWSLLSHQTKEVVKSARLSRYLHEVNGWSGQGVQTICCTKNLWITSFSTDFS